MKKKITDTNMKLSRLKENCLKNYMIHNLWKSFNRTDAITSITPFGATNGASEIVGLARGKLRRGTSN